MTHHRTTNDSRRQSFIHGALATALPIVLGACSNGDVSLGDGRIARDLSQPSRCAESTRLEGRVDITSQTELEALTGCEEIDGDLLLEVFENADLTPLASLRSVSGNFGIGFIPITYPEDPEAQARIEALMVTGYLPTLHGLESLESVGSLQLNYLLVEDLTELESLQTAREYVDLYEMRGLKTLAGLEAVSPPIVEIGQCGALETLEGLRLARGMDIVRLDSLPSLTNIDPLAEVIGINLLSIYGTGIQTLPELTLASADKLSIRGNPKLVDASGLRGLQGATEIDIIDNPLLTAFPALPSLELCDRLAVIGNGIETLALDFPRLQQKGRVVDSRTLELFTELVVIASNPNLTHVTIPAGFPAVQHVSVYDNASLTDIDFGNLQQANHLIIDSNPALEHVAPSSLTTVGSLEITNNPRLLPSALDEVQTFERRVAGNAGL